MSKSDEAALAKGAEAIRKAEREAKESTADKSVKTSWRDFKRIHPACEAFPQDRADIRTLADNIAANGLKLDILICSADGERYIYDGRSRLDACELLGWQLVDEKGEWVGRIVPRIKYVGQRSNSEIVAEVISLNLARRHLTEVTRSRQDVATVFWFQHMNAALQELIRSNPARRLRRSLDDLLADGELEACKLERALSPNGNGDVRRLCDCDECVDSKGVRHAWHRPKDCEYSRLRALLVRQAAKLAAKRRANSGDRAERDENFNRAFTDAMSEAVDALGL